MKVETKTEKAIEKDSFENVVKDVAKEYNSTPAVALAGIFATLQAGGTSNNKRSNVKITLQDKPFESKKINAIITRHCKGVTPRQFAKFFADAIFTCASRHKITGNAYVYLRRFHGNMLTETVENERFWCADFQIDNTNCPEYIRQALQKRYGDKFRNKRQS